MTEGPIGIVATSPYQVALFLRSHLKALPPSVGPLIFTNTEDSYRDLVSDLDMSHVPIGREHWLTRSDVVSAAMLRKQFRTAGVTTVVTISPKAGFVGQLAARSAGTCRRLHIFTGQVWEGLSTGAKRMAVMSADRAIGGLATHIAADSPSQAWNLKRTGIVPSGKSVAVPHPPGSIRGVDLNEFRPRPEARSEIRKSYGLTEDVVAFVQIGRLAHAKGVLDLVAAFEQLREAWSNGGFGREPRLYLVGPDEDGLGQEFLNRDGIEVRPFTGHPELILAAMDILVLASHREGFGSTVIEAAATGLPAIGTDIVGIRDAIVPGVTGWLVPRRSTFGLYAAMAHTVQNPGEVRRRGVAALERARRDFSAEQVARAWSDHLLKVHSKEL